MSSSASPPDMYKAIDDAWIGLLVLAIFILAASISAIIALCLLWYRYQRTRRAFQQNYLPSPKMTNRRAIPVQIDEYPNTSYETQKMEVFVPQGEDERNFGEVHARFSPEDGIEEMRQFHHRTSKAYF